MKSEKLNHRIVPSFLEAEASKPVGDVANVSYEMFMAQRSQIAQHSLQQVVGDMHLMNPISLVENHMFCRKNRAGHNILPNV